MSVPRRGAGAARQCKAHFWGVSVGSQTISLRKTCSAPLPAGSRQGFSRSCLAVHEHNPALQGRQGARSILNHSTRCQKTCSPPRARVTLGAQRTGAMHTGERVMAGRGAGGGRTPGKVRSERERGRKEGGRAAHPGNAGIRRDYRSRQLLLASSRQRRLRSQLKGRKTMTQEQERQPGHLGAGGEGGDERRGHGSPALGARARCEVRRHLRRHTRRRKGCSPNAVPSRGAPHTPGEFSSGPCPSSPILLQVAERRAALRVPEPGGCPGGFRDRGVTAGRGDPRESRPGSPLTLRAFSSRAEGRGAPVGESAAWLGAGLGAGPSAGLGATNKVPERRGRAPGSGNSRGAERSRAPSAGPPRPGHSPCPSPRPGRARGGPLRSSAVGQLRSPVAACRSPAGCRGTESGPPEPTWGRRLVSRHPKRSPKSPQSHARNLPRLQSKEVYLHHLRGESAARRSLSRLHRQSRMKSPGCRCCFHLATRAPSPDSSHVAVAVCVEQPRTHTLRAC